MKVVFLTVSDFAGTGWFTARAINFTGRVVCRQVSFMPHPWGFDGDLEIMDVNNVVIPEKLEEAKRLLDEADLIHIWNTELSHPWFEMLSINFSKVRAMTFSGSLYRLNHTRLNKELKKREIKLVVQNPTYRYGDEYDSVFIQHAIDIDFISTFRKIDREEKTIACYSRGSRAMRTTTREDDICFLEKELKRFTGWRTVLKERMQWRDRLSGLAKTKFCFEYMDPSMGWFGQGVLEACLLGVPAMTLFSDEALALTDGKVSDPIVLKVSRVHLAKALDSVLNLEEDVYRALGDISSKWVKDNFNFGVVGGLYADFLEEL